MKYIYVPLLFILFAGLSCQRAEKSYPSAMQRAISLLSARPDSALYYLSQLDSQMADEPEETRVYHRLLTLAAEDKLYVPHTSDSLIREIVRYYEGYGDSDKLMMAYYYQGSVWRDMNDALVPSIAITGHWKPAGIPGVPTCLFPFTASWVPCWPIRGCTMSPCRLPVLHWHFAGNIVIP